ncbi:LD-carboxypeptidase [Leptotrichia sp. OH3620_COT-345]|uniref:S66 family peptidase n=1 Tax=Leptotrichia sp. OH3620_COT-345 TaxID=2491048 RepID=UPI000F648405|nr:S66 peptidase family protein [Leptotrichia sp. OH3620_COT-345]RRD40719.1 LD-carboxypeptidase [Leptotrichia sp. OH3620_COT-345]
MHKPKILKKGDKIAVVSLSKGVLGENFCKHQQLLGTERLKKMGFRVIFMPNSLKGIEYIEKHPEKRAEDLKAAFKDDNIKGIICAIGGIDGYKIFPYLMKDQEFISLVKEKPKIFTGFSDTTVHHLMFHRLGMQSFYGPTFLTDIAELDNNLLPYTEKYWNIYLGNPLNKIISSDIWYEERTDFSEKSLGIPRISHKESRGFELLQGKETFSGKLLGGCLESLYNIISGDRFNEQKEICEKYKIFPSKEEWKGKILFIETAEGKPLPEEYEKMLETLKEKEIFNVINGIIVGKPQDEVYYDEYKKILCKVINNTELPILYNVNFGHAYPRCILPYGLNIDYNHSEKKILFKEPLFQ